MDNTERKHGEHEKNDATGFHRHASAPGVLERQEAPPFEVLYRQASFDRQVSFERQTSGRHVVELSKHVVSPLAPQHDVPPLRGLR